MPDLEQNYLTWNQDYDWPEGGEEWSADTGGSRLEWYTVLLPRIHAFVPTGTILEIAPGFGRWTAYLKDLGEHLIVVDLAERCIGHCRQRFAAASNIEYHVNDGRSLEMIADRSVDFVFSRDSLVHAEHDVVEGYLQQLARKLKPDGVGFIHHSNASSFQLQMRLARRVPERWLPSFVRLGIAGDVQALRADDGSADRFAQACQRAGLSCISQELIPGGPGPYLLDCFSVFAPQGSRWERPRVVLRNRSIRRSAMKMAKLYGDGAR